MGARFASYNLTLLLLPFVFVAEIAGKTIFWYGRVNMVSSETKEFLYETFDSFREED